MTASGTSRPRELSATWCPIGRSIVQDDENGGRGGDACGSGGGDTRGAHSSVGEETGGGGGGQGVERECGEDIVTGEGRCTVPHWAAWFFSYLGAPGQAWSQIRLFLVIQGGRQAGEGVRGDKPGWGGERVC